VASEKGRPRRARSSPRSERQLADRLAIRELAYRYARAVDRRDWALAATLFTEDAVLASPRFELVGAEKILRGLRSVERYRATFHAVHNQTLELAGDEASGETYCVANHFSERDGRPMRLDWGIRYQDRFRRGRDGVWRFSRRELIVDWEHEQLVVRHGD
jgi:ketosteroid isomerase-like protein